MFKFVDRGKKQSMVLTAGWAFDYRIFATLDLPYNYIFFCGDSAADFEDELKHALVSHGIEKINLFGWSQGAFVVCDFAVRNPEITEYLILVSMRKQYEKAALEEVKRYLMKNRTAYLYKFYRDCFAPQEKNYYLWFKKSLLKSYLQDLSLEQLVKGLDRLGEAEIRPDLLRRLKNIKIVHGGADTIAPVQEAVELSNSLPNSQLITFAQVGHLPFLQEGFTESLYEY